MKFYMAPLQSYTTSFYRKAHAQTYGKMDKYFTPFFEDTGEPVGLIKDDPELNSSLNSNLNVIPQVATHDGRFLIDFAQQMQNKGFQEININMGCPFPMLVKRQRGGGILAYPDKIKSMLDTFYSANPDIKLSVKMRQGVNETKQGLLVVKLLNHYQLEELIIHPRLVSQKYKGIPDWNCFELFQSQSIHRIVANGDINSPKDLEILHKRFPQTEAFMLGRGLLQHPDLFTALSQNNQTTISNHIQQLHTHYFNQITTYYKDWNRAFNFLQAFWKYPLSTSIKQQRLYRTLKKHNKPNLYALWLEKVWEHMH